MKKTDYELTKLLKENQNYSVDELRVLTKSKTNYSLFNKLFLIMIKRIREINFEGSIYEYEDILKSLDYVSEILASNSFIMKEKFKKDITLFKELVSLKKSEVDTNSEWYEFLSAIEICFYEIAFPYLNRVSKEEDSNKKKKLIKSCKDSGVVDNNPLSIKQTSKEDYYQYKSNLFDIFESTSYVNNRIITINDYINRLDLTGNFIFTIDDNPSCKRLDDAISIDYLPDDTYLLGVHIADISNFLLQRESFGGDTFADSVSFFLNNGNDIPIGIPTMVEYKYSLFPKITRETISYFIKLDSEGEIIDFGMYKTIIESKRKINCGDIDKILNSRSVTNLLLREKLYHLSKVALILDSKYKNRLVSEEELKYKSIRTNTFINGQIIEKAIVIASSSVASCFKAESLPIIYKNPSKKVPYTTEPTPHECLGVDAYCYISSPLVRTCDRFNQMIINDFCFSSKMSDKMINRWEDNVKKLVIRLNGNGKKNSKNDMLGVVS